jgi:P-type Cu2+ transporter
MTPAVERGSHPAVSACAHCGLPVPPGLVRDGDDPQFCCSGCRQVYALVRDWGFSRYYELVDRQRGALEPATVTGRAFTDFDDAQRPQDAAEWLDADRVRTRVYLEGVHCTACVWLVEKLPVVIDGVDAIRLNYATGVAEIVWRPGRTQLSTIARALDRLGYTPHLQGGSTVQDVRRSEDRATLARLGIAVACAMNLMFMSGALYAGEVSGMALRYESLFRWFSLLVAVPVLGFSAAPFFQTAIAGLRARVIHIDVPIAAAIAVGAAASAWNVVAGSGPLWFDSLAMLTAALLGARQLQRSAQRAALERADSLRGAAFLEFARRLGDSGADAESVEVPLTALVRGDRVEVRSGELIPVDGIVVSGRSSLDNAVLTGETAPHAVSEGDVVNAGACNLGARLIVRVEAAGEHTRVGALLAMVQDALTHKPALLQATDVMARRFVSVLLVVAVATAAMVFMRSGTGAAVERVVALLVVACPCALGLAVPLAMSMALMRAARSGIFIKNSDALDRLREVGVVLLDKTGTLTEGHATVTRWHGDAQAQFLAQALEAESSHAVARAFQATADRSVRGAQVEHVVERAGHGISGLVDRREVRVGNGMHVELAEASSEVTAAAASMVADGLSPVFVSVDGRVAGVAGIGDALRPDSRATVDALRRRGIRVCIVSGDHPEIVARVAARLGIAADDALGGLTPEAKRDLVGTFMSAVDRRGAVVMVGDGVNDAAALAGADVGIAVHGGTGASIVAADIVLTREGVAPLLQILDGARQLRGVIRRNLAFSLLYNLSASSLAVVGVVGPLLAAILMPVSSLTVVLSSSMTRTFVLRRRRVAVPRPVAVGAEA